jgi:hypothetical protein
LIHNLGVSLNVQAGVNFSLGIYPASQSVSAGSNTVYLVTATSTGSSSQTISFAASGLPTGATAVFNPPSVAGSGPSTLEIKSASNTANGNFSINVTGTSSSTIQSAPASLNVTAYQGPSSPATGPGLQFIPVTPCRIADTRNPTGPFGGPSIGAAASRNFYVPAATCGIPANAQAYSLNMTVVPLGPLGFLSVWPAGQPQAVVSTLNSSDGRVKANAAIVPAGANGGITVFASNPTHVIVDINGYFVTPNAQSLAFYPLPQCRIADTRLTAGTFGGPSLAGGQARTFPVVSSACNIPASAKAYSLNMTAIPPSGLGFLAVWPAGGPQPVVSTLNDYTGTITANAAIVPAGNGGAITVIATNPTDVLVDINGYYAPPGAPGGLKFYAVTPCRIFDTRSPEGPFGGPELTAGELRSFIVPLSNCQIPSTAQAYSLNTTLVPPSPLASLTLWGNSPMPPVAITSDTDVSIVDNAAFVSAASDGSVSAVASSATHLILDINGFFAP